MFDRDELLVLNSALSKLDIKGSDAMYIASLMSKINEKINQIDEEVLEKERKKQKIEQSSKK